MSPRYVHVSLLYRLKLIVPLQLFPGLIYRMIKPKVVLLIFVSGKIVLTGAKVKCQHLMPDYPLHHQEMYLCLSFAWLLTSYYRWPPRSVKRSTLRSTRFTPCLSNSASRDRPPRRCRRRRAPSSSPNVICLVIFVAQGCNRVWFGDGGRGRSCRKSWTPFEADTCITLPHSLRRRLPYDRILTYIATSLLTIVATCTYTSYIHETSTQYKISLYALEHVCAVMASNSCCSTEPQASSSDAI